jgi:hypothetical protein
VITLIKASQDGSAPQISNDNNTAEISCKLVTLEQKFEVIRRIETHKRHVEVI